MDSYSIEIQSAGVLDHDPSWRWDSSGVQDKSFVLWIISDGIGTLDTGDVRYELSRGDCLISPMSNSHYGRQDKKKLLAIPWLVFAYCDSKGKRFIPSPLPRRYRKVDLPAFIEDVVWRAVMAFQESDEETACHWAKAALIEIERFDRTRALYGRWPEHYYVFEKLAASIRKNPGDSYSLATLAKNHHCTLDHFIRLFKQYIKVTPGEFIIRCRIEKACQLLRYSSYQVGQIADMLGYGDIHHFSAQFQKRMGMSPSVYRKA